LYRLSLDTNFVPPRIATLGRMGRGGVKKPPARFYKEVITPMQFGLDCITAPYRETRISR
jgi:hypothetical protein